MISIFDLYKIGIGPSSSHTVGPMRAANLFINKLINEHHIDNTAKIKIELFGSLGATGKGHGSDKAILLGLMGETPEHTQTQLVNSKFHDIQTNKILLLNNKIPINFDYQQDLIFHHYKRLDYHPNALVISAFDADKLLTSETYYSIGGGFVIDSTQLATKDNITAQPNSSKPDAISSTTSEVPYPFTTAAELLALCANNKLSISEIVLANEKAKLSESEIYNKIQQIWQVMQDCVTNGCNNEGILPGGLNIKRRAPKLYQSLLAESLLAENISENISENNNNQKAQANAPLYEMDWVNLYALATNEENAAGGRIVTAPTNGAAGIIPAVLHYYCKFNPNYTAQEITKFLMTAGAIGIIIKQNASISGAEVGCQGEIGSACAMAAAGLTEITGGKPSQCTNAAEIGIEHNLGLTCDPISGLVQVPCIERNAMGAIKAINASHIAKRGDGNHFVSLDKAILTMKTTGLDMMEKYKETSQGGLATNVIEVPVNFVDC